LFIEHNFQHIHIIYRKGIVQYLGIYDVCDVSSSKLFHKDIHANTWQSSLWWFFYPTYRH